MSSGLNKMFLSVVAAAVLVSPQARAAATYYQQGVAEFNLHHYQKAIAYLTAACSAAPTNTAGAQYYLASSLLQLRQEAEALKHFQIVLQLHPTPEMKKLSQQAIKQLEKDVALQKAAEAAKETQEPVEAKETKPAKGAKSGKPAKVSEPDIDLGKLPPPPVLVKPSLYAGNARNWSSAECRQNIATASADLSACQQAAVAADTTYREVKSKLTGYLPSKADAKRAQAVHAIIDPVIERYKKLSETQAKYLKDAQAVYSACTAPQ